jgi:hypothetical protein
VGRVSGPRSDGPIDPFAGDPEDPADELRRLDDDDPDAGAEIEPLSPQEREGVLDDLAELDVFRALLEPRGTLGLVVDCGDCGEPHYFDWALLSANLRHLLDSGLPRVHEPAFAPDPVDYVSWDYARGFADGVLDCSDSAADSR